MNPGPVEEVGATTRGLVDALKAQPAVLALTIANLAMVAFIYYALHGAATFREVILANQFKMMQETSLLLSRCIVPEHKTEDPEQLGSKSLTGLH